MLSLIIFTFLLGGHIFISEGNYMSGGIKVSQYQQCGSVGILNDDIRIDEFLHLETAGRQGLEQVSNCAQLKN